MARRKKKETVDVTFYKLVPKNAKIQLLNVQLTRDAIEDMVNFSTSTSTSTSTILLLVVVFVLVQVLELVLVLVLVGDSEAWVPEARPADSAKVPREG